MPAAIVSDSMSKSLRPLTNAFLGMLIRIGTLVKLPPTLPVVWSTHPYATASFLSKSWCDSFPLMKLLIHG